MARKDPPSFEDDIQCKEARSNMDQEKENFILSMRSRDLEMISTVNDFT